MKRLNLFQKHFIYTISVMLLIVILIHGLIYSLIPKVYLSQKRNQLETITTDLVDHLEGKSIQYAFDFTENFALMSGTNVNLATAQYRQTFLGLMQFDIHIREDLSLQELQELQENLFVATPGAIDQAGLILNKQSFMLNENTQANIQVMMSVQPVYEIKEATLRLIPYSFLISIFISFAAAFYFSKKMSQPIRDLLDITEKMAAFEKDVFFESEGQDEVVALGYNINHMYLKLQTAIYELEDNIKEMHKIEREKEHFFKSASHELKTPLTSLSVLLENMQLNIGAYQDRDHYLKEALLLVNNANEKISQILSASDFQSISIKKNEFSLDSYVDGALTGYQHIIMKKELKLHLELNPVSILTDALYFKVVIDNLLSNAFYYVPEKEHVTIQLNEDELIIKNDLKKDVVIDMSLLFEPFYREDTSASSISKGTGLGLYLVKKNLALLQLDFEVQITDKEFIFKIFF